MYLESVICKKLCENLGCDATKMPGFGKLKNSIALLHNKYLLGACKEAAVIIKKYYKNNVDIFDLVISIYNKRIKSHHEMFLIIHIFKTALRSKVALVLSEIYSSNSNADDWFLYRKNAKLIKQAAHIAQTKKVNLTEQMNSFEVLDLFTLGDLQNIIDSNWSDFRDIFASMCEYKGQKLPEYGTKNSLLNVFSMIRKARNDIFHNNPPKTKAKSITVNIEILLLRLGFNLNDAFKNISNLNHMVNLKYKYD